MTARLAKESDIPAIVALLKLSLGESLMPKSEAFWRWKHLDNPFGPSPVLLAEEGDMLVGVRAFLRWDWQQQDMILKSVRAVDTATHPQHQGKGIFKKLTLRLAEQCQDEGIKFIFNTPNASSMPGYLKMGWQKYGRMPVSAFPVLPRFKKSAIHAATYAGETGTSALRPAPPGVLATATSKTFMEWRYGRNPNEQYQELFVEGSRIIFRIKPGKRFTEMRIVDGFYTGRTGGQFFSRIQQEAHAQGAQLITWAGFKLPFVTMPVQLGPIITLNTFGDNAIDVFKSWKPTLGDMEVF
jgi:N-acetylglutamate synthase-like GNAT family acetyltransferase